ncbi:60s acidic ribosomal protein-domain-containing protein [Entophlyctis helioformis]|nr:60s acidic ribosomal protein-domain-containing protein [Entophlyctis helioformis]
MKVLAAYLLASLAESGAPDAAKISAILSSVGIEAEDARIETLISELEGKDLAAVIAEGTTKLGSMPAGGAASSGAAPAAAAGAPAAAAASKKEEKKEEPKEESDDDMGFGLFD